MSLDQELNILEAAPPEALFLPYDASGTVPHPNTPQGAKPARDIGMIRLWDRRCPGMKLVRVDNKPQAPQIPALPAKPVAIEKAVKPVDGIYEDPKPKPAKKKGKKDYGYYPRWQNMFDTHPKLKLFTAEQCGWRDLLMDKASNGKGYLANETKYLASIARADFNNPQALATFKRFLPKLLFDFVKTTKNGDKVWFSEDWQRIYLDIDDVYTDETRRVA